MAATGIAESALRARAHRWLGGLDVRHDQRVVTFRLRGVTMRERIGMLVEFTARRLRWEACFSATCTYPTGNEATRTPSPAKRSSSRLQQRRTPWPDRG